MKLFIPKIRFKNIYHPDCKILYSKADLDLAGRLVDSISIKDDIGLNFDEESDVLAIEFMVTKRKGEVSESLNFKKLPTKDLDSIEVIQYPNGDYSPVEFITNRDLSMIYIKVSKTLNSKYQINRNSSVIYEIDKSNTLSGIWIFDIIVSEI